MFENIIDKINLGIKEQILAFFILWFAIYGTLWTIIEPLNLPIINEICFWKSLFISTTLLITSTFFFIFFFRKKLDCLGLEPGDSNLITEVNYPGEPKLASHIDGFHGKILVVKANYVNEPLDWNIKASANNANFLTITFKPEPDLKFYARVNVLSKNKKVSNQKWLRFEPNMSLPQSNNDDEEMGVPVIAHNDNGFLRVSINLSKTISVAFGHHGWTYDKVTIIRARGFGKIKNIIFN